MIDAGIAVDKQQRAIFIATGDYDPTQLQTMKGKIAAMESVLNRPLTEPEKLIALKLTDKPFISIEMAQKASIQAGVKTIAADITGLLKAGAQSQAILSNLSAFEKALDEAMESKTAVTPTGAFAKPILMASKIAIFLQDIFPKILF